MLPVLFVAAASGVPAGAVLVCRGGRRVEVLSDPYGASAVVAAVLALLVVAAVTVGLFGPVDHVATWLVSHLSAGHRAGLSFGGSR